MANTHFVLPLHYKNLSQATATWSDEEFGCYVRLLIHQWDQYEIPEDLGRLGRIADSIERNKGLVLRKFEKVEGKFLNKKMEEIRAEKISFSRKQSMNGSQGGRGKIKKQKPIKSQTKAKKKPLGGEGEEEELGKGLEKGKVVHELQQFINEKAPKILLLRDQLTEKECESLSTDFDKATLNDVILSMQNYKDLVKKYDSVNLTIRSWANRRTNNSTNQNGATGKNQPRNAEFHKQRNEDQFSKLFKGTQ